MLPRRTASKRATRYLREADWSHRKRDCAPSSIERRHGRGDQNRTDRDDTSNSTKVNPRERIDNLQAAKLIQPPRTKRVDTAQWNLSATSGYANVAENRALFRTDEKQRTNGVLRPIGVRPTALAELYWPPNRRGSSSTAELTTVPLASKVTTNTRVSPPSRKRHSQATCCLSGYRSARAGRPNIPRMSTSFIPR